MLWFRGWVCEGGHSNCIQHEFVECAVKHCIVSYEFGILDGPVRMVCSAEWSPGLNKFCGKSTVGKLE